MDDLEEKKKSRNPTKNITTVTRLDCAQRIHYQGHTVLTHLDSHMRLNACNVLSKTFISAVKLLVKYISVRQTTVCIASDVSLRIGYQPASAVECRMMFAIQRISNNVVYPKNKLKMPNPHWHFRHWQVISRLTSNWEISFQ